MQLTDIQLGALKYAIGALPNSPTGRIASDTICQIVTAHNAGAQGEPEAYLHEMHMEGDQTYERLTFDTTNAFGEPGRDYDSSYEVTCTPLYTHPQPITDAARDGAWHMVCGDWRDEKVAIHGPNGHIASGLTIEQARAIIDAHGGKCASATAEIERLDRAKGE